MEFERFRQLKEYLSENSATTIRREQEDKAARDINKLEFIRGEVLKTMDDVRANEADAKEKRSAMAALRLLGDQRTEARQHYERECRFYKEQTQTLETEVEEEGAKIEKLMDAYQTVQDQARHERRAYEKIKQDIDKAMGLVMNISAEGLHIRLTQVDPAEPCRLFECLLRVQEADTAKPKYEEVFCRPLLHCWLDLVEALNSYCSLGEFVCRLRKGFRQSV
eukprot:GHVS01105850.1.p1 GENE.GHVS01105850.1~~GHVS01105850.1.p1  ORF type:complete len:222 (-),score=35.14 GHVS01105850.1:591-1256(-)